MVYLSNVISINRLGKSLSSGVLKNIHKKNKPDRNNLSAHTSTTSVRAGEVEKFSKEAPKWWDENGPFSPLHKLNPVRMGYIRDRICSHFDLDEDNLKVLSNISVLDVGCGGGLVCEPLARMGAKVTGIDADPIAIDVAKQHAKNSGLNITYSNECAENMAEQFDVVCALEIIEHVEDQEAFVKTCANLVKPDGLIIFSTLNRTLKSYGLGIITAEYILRWLPTGTHEWKNFVKPSKLVRMGQRADLTPNDMTGMIYNPLEQAFKLSKSDIDVNYFLCFKK